MKVTEIYKQQRSGPPRPAGGSKKSAEPAGPSGRATAPAAAVEQLSTDEQDEATLRQFDLATKFGPCSGMSRLERWERALELGLDPPAHVKELVLQHGENTMFNRCLWEHPA